MEELPEGWVQAPLGDCIQPGGLFDGPFGSSLKSADYTASGARVIRLENLASLRFIDEKLTFISAAKYQTLKKHTVHEGDVLFGSFVDGATRVCLVPRLAGPAIAKADCFCVRPEPRLLDARFLVYQLGAVATRDALVEQIHGVTRPRITTKQLRQFILRLPPLAEQKRIVEKVEALLTQVQAARDCLERAQQILKRFRQSVLAAGLRGPFGAASGAGAWPQGELGSVLKSFEAGRNLRAEGRRAQDGEFGVLKLSAVTWGEFRSWENKALLKGDAPREHEIVRRGDLLISRANTSELVGAVVLVEEDHPLLMLPDKILRLVVDESRVDKRFLLQALRSVEVREHFEANATGTSESMRNLSQPKIAAAQIVLPPLPDQRLIAGKIEALLRVAASLEGKVRLATRKSSLAPQAILARVFAGKLVPTEAELARVEGRGHESGLELIARVRKVGARPGGADRPSRGRKLRRG